MNVLAINFNHDGAVAVVSDGTISGFVNTERFSRLKKHPGVRDSDVCEALRQAGLRLRDVDMALLLNLHMMDSPEIPQLHGTTLKETWAEFWIDATFSRARLFGEVVACQVPTGHHEYHAVLPYLFSPFDSAVSLACDPIGARAYYYRDGRAIGRSSRLSLVAPLVYARVAGAMFGTSLVGAGKLMGLAPYGEEGHVDVDYAALSGMPVEKAYQALIAATRDHCVEVVEADTVLNASLAYHAQAFLESELAGALDAIHQRGMALGVAANLCLSGGTALNSAANQHCFANSPFEQVYLHPACGDDGTALGAALGYWHLTLDNPKRPRSHREAMYSCRVYGDGEVAAALRQFQDDVIVRETDNEVQEAAELIAQGRVIGWFQGPSEIGPRALGNRSILADPRDGGMRDYLNGAIKQRERFRPFAPSVLREHAARWFDVGDSPFMLRVARVRGDGVPAITHVDGTARIQTVDCRDNPRYFELISRFHALTGVPMVLNTSFNGKAEPIVESPGDALRCMLRSNLDALVFPSRIVTRRGYSCPRPAAGQ